MDESTFEQLLDAVCLTLNARLVEDVALRSPAIFEGVVRQVCAEELAGLGASAALEKEDQGFPDIVMGDFGVEVKATEADSWRSIANSVSEGRRALSVRKVYVIFGKMGGVPRVRWADYGTSIIHVRTSHVPRYEIELGSERSLFQQIGIAYEDFRGLPMPQKMDHIRSYARSRLKPGERLWWLEDKEPDEQTHSLPLNVRLFMDLSMPEKRRLRAEAALMCPQVVGGSRQRRKYNDAVLFLMTYRGVLCPQARDLFSAGSVAGPARGGNYLQRALIGIEQEMRQAALDLEDALFAEYWGVIPEPQDRIAHWLGLADRYAKGWVPSQELFRPDIGR